MYNLMPVRKILINNQKDKQPKTESKFRYFFSIKNRKDLEKETKMAKKLLSKIQPITSKKNKYKNQILLNRKTTQTIWTNNFDQKTQQMP